MQRVTDLLIEFFEVQVRQQYVVGVKNEAKLVQTMHFIGAGYFNLFRQCLSNESISAKDLAFAAEISGFCLAGYYEKR